MNKKCTHCKEVKCETDFAKTPANLDGRHSWCKACVNDNKRTRYAKDVGYRNRLRETRRKYLATETGKIYQKRGAAKFAKSPKGKYKSYKNHAKYKQCGFYLSFVEFMTFWQQSCFYCGDSIETIGLDRIDNTKGYTMGNVVPCCEPCNKAKLTRTVKEFINHCQRVVDHSSVIV